MMGGKISNTAEITGSMPPCASNGFIAGTSVHTDQCLVPIEQIKVGDLVLSAPESGEWELVYRRVVNTFVCREQPIVRVLYESPDIVNEPDKKYALTSTLDHPFWIEAMGWTAASARLRPELEEGRLRLSHRSPIKLFGRRPVFSTSQPGIGWIGSRTRLDTGSLWDYTNGKLVANGVSYDWRNWVDGDVYGQDEHPDLYQRASVYNIEVEEFHTYFVGKHGVWVHD